MTSCSRCTFVAAGYGKWGDRDEDPCRILKSAGPRPTSSG